MKRIVRLTESDLLKIVKRVISEQETQPTQTPSDNNFVKQIYTKFTNLLTPSVKAAFVKQYPVQDAITELESCKPSKFDNFKTKMEGLKQKLKSFVSGGDLTKDIQSISYFFEKNPNVNEQTGVVVLSGLAMLLLVSMYKSFLFFHGYVPSKSCMGQGSHLPYYIEGTVNLLRDLIHFDVHPFIGGPKSGRKEDKFDAKKHQKSLKNIDKEYNRQQKQQSKQDAQNAQMMKRMSQNADKEACSAQVQRFESYVTENEPSLNVKQYLRDRNTDRQDVKDWVLAFYRDVYGDESGKINDCFKQTYKLTNVQQSEDI